LLGPAGLFGVVGLKLHLALGEQVALKIEQQRPNALGAVVDGQQVVFIAQDTTLSINARRIPDPLRENRSRIASGLLLFRCVGWVEQGDTHQFSAGKL
jgi:hypothetical protein